MLSASYTFVLTECCFFSSKFSSADFGKMFNLVQHLLPTEIGQEIGQICRQFATGTNDTVNKNKMPKVASIFTNFRQRKIEKKR
jgi:hypothetical protein